MNSPDSSLAARLAALFSAIDERDVDQFVQFLTPDATFRFGSAPPVQGRQAIADAVAGFFATIAGCSHRLDRTVADGGAVICEGEVSYQRQDGSSVTLPFVDVFEMDGELIDQYKIYLDIGPLYAA